MCTWRMLCNKLSQKKMKTELTSFKMMKFINKIKQTNLFTKHDSSTSEFCRAEITFPA